MPKQKAIETDSTQQPRANETETNLTQASEFLSRWNTNLMAFYAHRYQQYGTLPMRLLACSSVSDLQELQREFLQQLATDYRNEAAKLSRMAGAASTQSDASAEANYAATLQKAQRDAAVILDEAKAQAEQILKSAEERASQLTEPPEEQVRKRA